MLLTVLWGSCLLVGKCDIEGTTAVDLKDTKRFSLTGNLIPINGICVINEFLI